MLTGVDSQSGEPLDDENIRAQCITFLVAGHETTSGLLSFATYSLLKNPDVLARAYEEVDRVLGTDLGVLPTYAAGPPADLRRPDPQRERCASGRPRRPSPGRRTRTPRSAAGTRSPKDSVTTILIPMLHRDPAVWGAGPRGVRSGPLLAREPAEDPGQRLQAVRHRPAGLHRPAVRDAGGDPGARDDPAALRADRPPGLPAHDQADADDQAGRPDDQGPAAARPDRHAAAGPRERDRPRPRRRPGPPRRPCPVGRSPRDAAAGAVRLEPRHRRGAGADHRRRTAPAAGSPRRSARSTSTSARSRRRARS